MVKIEKMQNPLNVEVSYFRNCAPSWNDPPQAVNLLTFLRSEKYRPAVERVRAIENKPERDKLKKEILPGITPSGVFTYRAEKYLVKHSGLIAGDIDFVDNPYSPETIKQQISKIKNVAYCGLSVSGRGLWFLVPIAYPQRHKEHFEALVKDFAKLGVSLDTAPANVASFRFYSYDSDAWFNPVAVPYERLLSRQPDTYTPNSNSISLAGNDGEKLEAVVRQIETKSIDITGNYDTWFSLLGSLATLGEAGRDIAHRISRFYIGYDHRETDKQFSNCLRMKPNRFTLGTLFKIADDNGIRYAAHFAKIAAQSAPQTPNIKAPTPLPMPAPRCEPEKEPAASPQGITLTNNWNNRSRPTSEMLNNSTVEPITDAAENRNKSKLRLMESYGFSFLGFSPMTEEDNEIYLRIMDKSGIANP